MPISGGKGTNFCEIFGKMMCKIVCDWISKGYIPQKLVLIYFPNRYSTNHSNLLLYHSDSNMRIGYK